jgi:hypothetical protein
LGARLRGQLTPPSDLATPFAFQLAATERSA